MARSPDPYRAYLAARHARFAVPAEAIRAVVRSVAGAEPTALRRIVRGHDNEVYAVEAPPGYPLVVRIHRAGEISLAEEAWALAQARAAGVPVPEVRSVGRIGDADGKPLEIMVQTRVPGRSLADVRSRLSPGQWSDALANIGRVLTRLHAVRVGGFWHREPDGRWMFPTWAAVMASTLHNRTAEAPWLGQGGLTNAECAAVFAAIDRYGREFDCPSPVLCHGDLLPEHVFVDDRLNVTGVIDFGLFEGNHPVHDLAVMSMSLGGADVRAVIGGFSLWDEPRAAVERRLAFHLVTLLAGYLAHHARIAGHPEVPHYRDRLRAALADLDRSAR
jgi:aminoglycoside phosphotransferase (APT) family kinase protein